MLLLLPELYDNAITDTDPVTTTSGASSPSVMPTLELVNKELINDDSRQELFSNSIDQPRVSVNGLTASWTHVSLTFNIICESCIHAQYKNCCQSIFHKL